MTKKNTDELIRAAWRAWNQDALGSPAALAKALDDLWSTAGALFDEDPESAAELVRVALDVEEGFRSQGGAYTSPGIRELERLVQGPRRLKVKEMSHGRPGI